MRTFEALSKLLVLCGAAFATLAAFDAVYAGNISRLHSFSGGSDGYYPKPGYQGWLWQPLRNDRVWRQRLLRRHLRYCLQACADGTETVLHAFTGEMMANSPCPT